MTQDCLLCDEVLIALRRITRAIDLHSRKLVLEHGITGPQSIVLRRLQDQGPVSIGQLAKGVNVSQATVTDILDRLEKRGLVQRSRSQTDKRCVLVAVTEAGTGLLQTAPPLLQEHFVAQFQALQDWEQSFILSSLQRVALMMDAQDLDVAPILESRALDSLSGEPPP